MNADTLSAIAGALLSLAFSYIPGLQARFDPLDGVYKRLIMLGLLVLAASAAFSAACAGWAADLGLGLSCDRSGLIGLLHALFLAIVANQAAFLISPPLSPRANQSPTSIPSEGNGRCSP
ncbi:MAG: hypothetical protein ACNA8H_06975 [Anaerolineales bacterium]